MFMFSIRVAVAIGLLALPLSVGATENDSLQEQSSVPKEVKTTADIVKAVETHHRDLMGVVDPPNVRTAQFKSDEIQVFVAWHSPFSGVKGCFVFVYLFDASKNLWTKEMSKIVKGTNDLSVEFGDKVILRDEDGKVVYTHLVTVPAIDPATIKDKVSIQLGDELITEFHREGNRLLQPAKSKVADDHQATVVVKLELTSASPFPPPREGATRPFLSVVNNFDSTLHFRALVRQKGSTLFFELSEEAPSLAAKSTFLKCWDFDTAVEEVVLYDFKLSNEKPE